MQQRAVLTIAGSDCSGGAGIQADLKTFTAHGCYGATAITSLVAENTVGVQEIFPSPPLFVVRQILSVLQDISMDALKTGVLVDAEITKAVVHTLKTHYGGNVPPLVCDPVCVSTSGHSLLNPDAIDVMVKELFPLATLITPNKSEAELLLAHGRPGAYPGISTLEDMYQAGKDFFTQFAPGPKAILLKGGHVTATLVDVDRVSSAHPEISVVRDGLFGDNMEILQVGRDTSGVELVVDMLCESNGDVNILARPRIESTSTHGTGCTLSAAIACGLAQGLSLLEATKVGASYTHMGIENAVPFGKGHGPLNHLHSIAKISIPRSTPSNPYPFTKLLIQENLAIWKDYVEHDFVKRLAQGVLARESFIHFVKQDYHYLKYYARAYGLLAAKSTTFPAIESATQTILNVLHEIGNHTAFCARFGITAEELESTEESAATIAYGGYLLDIGLQGDRVKLLMALLACLLGYGEVGLWIKKEAAKLGSLAKLEGNPYLHWIEDYSGPEYQNAVRLGMETIEACAMADPPSPARYKDWCEVWRKCTKLEKGFWDMAMKMS
ncbi:Phosphomethylpyrimidine kinase-domain-containing protein [Armillaria fumosa]|nr:Phosphomethylpyrimidine kinase-domain-containing protein [Armillaria fumosa]